MKRNNFWLWSNICTSFSLVVLLSFLTAPVVLPVVVPFFKNAGVAFAGNAFMIAGAVIVICAVIAGWVSYLKNDRKLCLVSNIICNVGEILSLAFFPMFLPGIILGYLGYIKMNKE